MWSEVASGDSDVMYGFIDGDDHYPEILVGRFSASTTEEVAMYVKRTINYERNATENDDFYKAATFIASDQGPGDENEYDFEHCRGMRQKMLDYTYTTGYELYDGDQGEADMPGNPNPEDVINTIEAGIGADDAHEQLDEHRLVLQPAQHEDVDHPEREADERQDEAEEQELRQRVLAAEAGHAQFLHGALVGQRPLQVEPIDDVAHADRLLLAQALAASLDLRGYDAKAVDLTLDGRSIATALQDAAIAQGAQLLAMGGFGHSRMRDFILGGATKGVLGDLRLAVLLSH